MAWNLTKIEFYVLITSAFMAGWVAPDYNHLLALTIVMFKMRNNQDQELTAITGLGQLSILTKTVVNVFLVDVPIWARVVTTLFVLTMFAICAAMVVKFLKKGNANENCVSSARRRSTKGQKRRRGTPRATERSSTIAPTTSGSTTEAKMLSVPATRPLRFQLSKSPVSAGSSLRGASCEKKVYGASDPHSAPVDHLSEP